MTERSPRPAPTLKDVALRAGVSLSTASRTLNGQSSLVRDELRERVLAASRDLGYVPNAQAQGLARATTSTIGLLVHDITNPYFAAIAQGAIEAANAVGLFVVIGSDHRDPERQLQQLSSLAAQRVRAVILAGSGFESPDVRRALDQELDAMRQIGVRAACISEQGVRADTVAADDQGGMRALADALVELGHRDFAVISGPAALTTARQRREAFVDALRAKGIAVDPEHVVDGGFTRDGGYAAARHLLRSSPGITAIAALTDVMAVGALAACRDLGISAPDEISITGFGDIQLAADVHPPLSTVRVPTTELGRRATELVLTPAAAEPVRVELPTAVLLRGSTASPRAAARLT